MPKKKDNTTLAHLPAVDLAYAVERLVSNGKTTTAQVLRLAAERAERIAAIEEELKALKHGGGLPAAPAPAPRTPRPRAAAKAKATKPAPPRLNLSPELRAFRQIQGVYAGYLRNFTGATRERIKAIGQAKGFDVAVAEMRKLLPAKGAPQKANTKASPARKPPAQGRVAPAKKPTMTRQRRAQLKIHGAYIGMMRGLADPAKAKIKALAKEKGMEAAIAVMKKAAK